MNGALSGHPSPGRARIPSRRRLLPLVAIGILALGFALHCGGEKQSTELDGIIFIVGDGMGLSMISQASLESAEPLALESMPIVGLQKTYSTSGSITDSAAAITAMLTGHKTRNKWIGVDESGQRRKTLFEIAQERNWSTAIISTSSVTHATPAGALVHSKDRHNDADIARQLSLNPPDILIGGGRDYFFQVRPLSADQTGTNNPDSDESPGPEGSEGYDATPSETRKTDVSTFLDFLSGSHTVQLSYQDFMSQDCDDLCVDGKPADRFIGLLAQDHLPPVDPNHKLNYKKDDANPNPRRELETLDASLSDWMRGLLDNPPPEPGNRKNYLKTASLRSLRTLLARQRPFLMLIEGSQIDWGGHANRADYAIRELVDLDETLEALLRETEGRNVLIVVTADHETGGHAIVDGRPGSLQKSEFITHKHTAEMVPVFARGPGAESFTGVYENTDIFHKLLAVMNATPAFSH